MADSFAPTALHFRFGFYTTSCARLTPRLHVATGCRGYAAYWEAQVGGLRAEGDEWDVSDESVAWDGAA